MQNRKTYDERAKELLEKAINCITTHDIEGLKSLLNLPLDAPNKIPHHFLLPPLNIGDEKNSKVLLQTAIQHENIEAIQLLLAHRQKAETKQKYCDQPWTTVDITDHSINFKPDNFSCWLNTTLADHLIAKRKGEFSIYAMNTQDAFFDAFSHCKSLSYAYSLPNPAVFLPIINAAFSDTNNPWEMVDNFVRLIQFVVENPNLFKKDTLKSILIHIIKTFLKQPSYPELYVGAFSDEPSAMKMLKECNVGIQDDLFDNPVFCKKIGNKIINEKEINECIILVNQANDKLSKQFLTVNHLIPINMKFFPGIHEIAIEAIANNTLSPLKKFKQMMNGLAKTRDDILSMQSGEEDERSMTLKMVMNAAYDIVKSFNLSMQQ
jgi:hypothetical protein